MNLAAGCWGSFEGGLTVGVVGTVAVDDTGEGGGSIGLVGAGVGGFDGGSMVFVGAGVGGFDGDAAWPAPA
jgi:hypothetical protein